MLARSIVGSPDRVRAGIDALITEMIVSDAYDQQSGYALSSWSLTSQGSPANLLGSRRIALKLRASALRQERSIKNGHFIEIRKYSIATILRSP
jgi:hypothetical protein